MSKIEQLIPVERISSRFI